MTSRKTRQLGSQLLGERNLGCGRFQPLAVIKSTPKAVRSRFSGQWFKTNSGELRSAQSKSSATTLRELSGLENSAQAVANSGGVGNRLSAARYNSVTRSAGERLLSASLRIRPSGAVSLACSPLEFIMCRDWTTLDRRSRSHGQSVLELGRPNEIGRAHV